MPALVTRQADRTDAAVFVHLVPDPLVDAEQEWQWLACLEQSLAEAVVQARAGEVESVNLIGDEWVLSAHGPSVDSLWAAMSKVLARWPLPANSYALHRHGAAGTRLRHIAIADRVGSDLSAVGRPAASAWRPVSEQGLLAALATVSSAA